MGNGAVGFRSDTHPEVRPFYMNPVPGLQNRVNAAGATLSGELNAAVPGRLAGLMWTTLTMALADGAFLDLLATLDS
jgi:hypothetical protein